MELCFIDYVKFSIIFRFIVRFKGRLSGKFLKIKILFLNLYFYLGGKLVDATKATESELQAELDKVNLLHPLRPLQNKIYFLWYYINI